MENWCNSGGLNVAMQVHQKSIVYIYYPCHTTHSLIMSVSSSAVASFCVNRFQSLAVYFADLTIDELLATIQSLTLERFLSIVFVEKNLRALATVFLLDLVTSKWSCGMKIPKAVTKLEFKDCSKISVTYVKDVMQENSQTLQDLQFSGSQMDNLVLEEIIKALQSMKQPEGKKLLQTIDVSKNPGLTNGDLKEQLSQFAENVVV
jgi:hypothetical protein